MSGSALTFPPARPRRLTGGSDLVEIAVALETVTPILGGGTATRDVDQVDLIRVPTLRGHLRFWWRALFAHECPDAATLSQREAALWGWAASGEGRRSAVEIRVSGVGWTGRVPEGRKWQEEAQDRSPVDHRAEGAYALWPARQTHTQDTAPRWKPGIRFKLALRVPANDAEEVRQALRAWILFGGYGSRTRRGCGSLMVTGPNRAEWLPQDTSREQLRRLLGSSALEAQPWSAANDLPLLRGAVLHAGVSDEGWKAWLDALGWLRDFRQGAAPTPRDTPARYAREHGPRTRPGRSNWPEPDKVRHQAGEGPWAHEPRLSKKPAWPRGGFGIPIVGQFQRKDRSGAPYRTSEPEDYELRWMGADGAPHDRLASPLIVKAMPLADGRFAPIALWLFRGYPEGGKVVLKWKGHPKPVADSGAPFGLLQAPGDPTLFAPLRQATLREAFETWLCGPHKVKRI